MIPERYNPAPQVSSLPPLLQQTNCLGGYRKAEKRQSPKTRKTYRFHGHQKSVDPDRRKVRNIACCESGAEALASIHIGRALKNLGIEKITEAENGREAVEILDRGICDKPFDTDTIMEIIRNIRVEERQLS